MDSQPPSKTPEPTPPGKGGASSNGGPPPRPRFSTPGTWLLLVLALVAAFLYFSGDQSGQSEITYGFFRKQLAAKNIAKVDIQGSKVYGEFREPPVDPNAPVDKDKEKEKEKEGEKQAKGDGEDSRPLLKKKFYADLPPYAMIDDHLDSELFEQLGNNYKATQPPDNTGTLMMVYLVVTVLLFGGIWFMFRRARDQFVGGGILSSFGKSPARRYQSGAGRVTFNDVAGLEGVKNEMEELVEFLKNPAKFQRLGGRVPKGVLLMGPPGTGKTLLGRAVAGEAEVPFFSISGSEFIQMFVGVGASRVRDLFVTAKENAPAILFIDEIDAVGRHRGAGFGGGHDEREQTLNQILSEMDGFTQNDSVIVMAATNRPDVLDPALLRPGRFDRHITVDRPNAKGRREIFVVHTRKIPLADDVDLDRLAAGTVGLTGADIRNLANEAALWATRQDRDKVTMEDFEYARDKVLMGSKREEVLVGREKSMTAYHESGHALLAWLVRGIDRLHKVSIIPRGRSLGATQLLPEEDRVNIGETELHTRLLFLLGGRAAEKLVFDEYSAGAEDDLKKATSLARRMVTHWGMSERLGPVAFRAGEEHPFLGKEMAGPREFSEHTAQVIDEEISRILGDASKRAGEILARHRGQLDKLAKKLEEVETLDDIQIEELIGPSAHNKAEPSGDGQASGDGSAHPKRQPTP